MWASLRARRLRRRRRSAVLGSILASGLVNRRRRRRRPTGSASSELGRRSRSPRWARRSRSRGGAGARRRSRCRAPTGLEGQVVQGQAAEDVVHDRLRHPDVGVVGEAGGLEAQVGELRDVGLQRDAVLQADRDRDREGVHHAGQGRALLAELEEDLAELAVVVGAGGHVALGAADGERRGPRGARLRQPLAGRGVDDLLDRPWRGLGRRGVGTGTLVLLGALRLAVGQRLADLAVVAVDRGRLEAELPRLQVDVLDLLDRGVLRQVDRLGDRAGQERLGGRHHPHVAHRLEGPRTHRASKTS